MGLISDTFEDNRERAWDGIPWTGPLPRFDPSHAAPPRPTFLCPACGLVLSTEQGLARHLFEQHARDLFFVRLNEVVVPDVYFTRQPIRTLTAITMGTSQLQLTLGTSDGRHVNGGYASGDIVDVAGTLGLAPDFVGTIWISGKVGTYERMYQIHARRLPDFDPTMADQAVVAAQEPLLEGQDPALRTIIRARDLEPLNSLSRRYLDGFGEYLEGVLRERRGDWESARERYEDAFGLLRVFPGALAQSAVAVLEFRMLAGKLLMRRGDASLFWPAGAFLESLPTVTAPPRPREQIDVGIWIDDFQEGLLLGIDAYGSGRFDEAVAAVRGLPESMLDGPGNRRRAALIAARSGRASGDQELARRGYRELEDDQTYAEEARKFLEGS